MGGIKNRLSKLIYEPPFRKRGVVPVALRVGVPLTSQRYDDSRYNNRISIGGFDRVVRITKYTSLACLTLAILSTLVLNIISSCSNSSTRSNAEPVSNSSTSTLANNNDSSTCDPSNTNAESCISLSISSHSATGDTNDGNLSLSIPQGGGLVAGRHTVSVNTNNINGVALELHAPDQTSLISSSNSSTILSIGGENGPDSYENSSHPLDDHTWGVAMPDSTIVNGTGSYDVRSVYEQYITNPSKVDDKSPRFSGVILQQKTRASFDPVFTVEAWSNPGTHSINVYYGVRIDEPAAFPAGNYSTSVVYTAIAELPPTPSNLSVTPTTYEFDSCNDSLITIKGNNLSSAYEVYLQKSGTSDEANRLACTNLNLDSTNNQLTCNIPTSREEVELNTTYDIYVISQAASPGVLQDAFTYTEPATGLSVKSDNENIIVDYDTNMIPVKYVDYDGNGGGYWQVVTDKEIEQNTDNWFRYGTTNEDKRWANAITVTAEAREAYRKKQTGEDPDPRILPSDNPTGNGEANPEILGYWVYIPRYAYEVQRRDAIDRVVDPQNFDIVFQTASEKNTPAPTLSTESNHLDYRNSGINRTYIANSNNTTWATNPAFTWGDTELNGIWVGKYETTGTRTAPTVKPNQHANISEYIGNFYSMARSIGKEDKCNVGGGSSSNDPTDDLVQNSHNLATTKSHMLKNSEWGAITYLAHSKYGAGINTSYTSMSNVSKNGAWVAGVTDADGDTDSGGYSAATGCGPSSAGDAGYYSVDTKLDENTIESNLACDSADKAYNGSTGVLASTTNNGSSDTGQGVYGVYDLAGGVGEYVMGSSTSSTTESDGSSYTMEEAAVSPYVDLYVATPNGPFGTKPSWSSSSSEQYYNYDVCTFETCGGTATYETTTTQSVSGFRRSWGGTHSSFVYPSIPWFYRGSHSYDSSASPFYTNSDAGYGGTDFGFRAALLAFPAEQ